MEKGRKKSRDLGKGEARSPRSSKEEVCMGKAHKKEGFKPKKLLKEKCKKRQEIIVAIAAMCPEFTPLQLCVGRKLIKNILKHYPGEHAKAPQAKGEQPCESCKKECKGTCQGMCKEKSCGGMSQCCENVCKCCMCCKCGCQSKCCEGGCKCCKSCTCGCQKKVCEEKCKSAEGEVCKKEKGKSKESEESCARLKDIKHLVKQVFVSEKERTLMMMQTALDTFAKVKGKPVSQESHEPHNWFVKGVVKLMCKMYKKNAFTKEAQEKMGEKFWEKGGSKYLKKMKRKVKNLAKKAVFYNCEGCEKSAQKGVAKAILRAIWGICMAKSICPKLAECKKEGEGKKEESTCKPCGSTGFVNKKYMKKFLAEGAARFAGQFIQDNKEIILTCSKVVKEAVDAYFTDNPPHGYIDKFKSKLISKIIARCIILSGGEKKIESFYAEIAKRFIIGTAHPCSKKCFKSCRKLATTGLTFNGVTGSCKLHLASHWAALMCCHTNGKIGCPKEICTEFFSKWIKDFMPLVEEALKAMEELKEECKECKEHSMGEWMKCKITSKIVLEYLRLYCPDGKFNKEDFKKSMKEGKEIMKKLSDKYMKHFSVEACCKGEMKISDMEIMEMKMEMNKMKKMVKKISKMKK